MRRHPDSLCILAMQRACQAPAPGLNLSAQRDLRKNLPSPISSVRTQGWLFPDQHGRIGTSGHAESRDRTTPQAP
jgi:hypothetical protein